MAPLFEQTWPDGDYRFFQLGFVVNDLITAAGRWATVFGVGPFHVLPPMTVDCTYRGARGQLETQVAVAQAGPVQIELVAQRCQSPSIFVDHLASAGSSALHQLCTVTSDFDGKLAALADAGHEVVTEFHTQPKVAFVDTMEDFGFYTEVVEGSAEFLRDLTGIAKTCADWDGSTDPIRLLTRDGYKVP